MKALFSFKGRVSRLKFAQVFFEAALCLVVFSFLIAWTTVSFVSPDESDQLVRTGLMVLKIFLQMCETVVIFSAAWILSANWTKRLHDVEASGWYQLILLVPYINLGMLILFFAKGTPGPNKYGDQYE